MKPITMYCCIPDDEFNTESIGDPRMFYLYDAPETAADDQSIGEYVVEVTFRPIGKVGIVPLETPEVPVPSIPAGGTPGIFEGAAVNDLFNTIGDGMTRYIRFDAAGAYHLLACEGHSDEWAYDEDGRLLGYEHVVDFKRHIVSRA